MMRRRLSVSCHVTLIAPPRTSAATIAMYGRQGATQYSRRRMDTDSQPTWASSRSPPARRTRRQNNGEGDLQFQGGASSVPRGGPNSAHPEVVTRRPIAFLITPLFLQDRMVVPGCMWQYHLWPCLIPLLRTLHTTEALPARSRMPIMSMPRLSRATGQRCRSPRCVATAALPPEPRRHGSSGSPR